MIQEKSVFTNSNIQIHLEKKKKKDFIYTLFSGVKTASVKKLKNYRLTQKIFIIGIYIGGKGG